MGDHLETDRPSPAIACARCSVVFAQKLANREEQVLLTTADEAGERKELVYNNEVLQTLLTIAGIKLRRARPMVESIMQQLSTEAHKDAGHRLIECTSTPKDDGTVSVELKWEDLMQVVASVVQAYSFHPSLKLADSLLQRERGVIILICGTSGTGKSTLASLLGQKLGISTIMSTDSIRNMLRGFASEEQDPVLHASSYETDNALLRMRPELAAEPQRRLIKLGYKAQCSTVLSQVMKLVNIWHSSCTSVIVEGVHLHLKQVMQMMTQHPSILPFLVYIKKEAKHIERMSVRAKYMTTDPSKNKYVKNIRGIRQIQDYLLRSADKVAVPKVANSNVDMTVDIIHKTVMAALHRQTDVSESMLDENGHATPLLAEFDRVYSQHQSHQTQMKETHARIHSLVEHSTVMQNMSTYPDPIFEYDSPEESALVQETSARTEQNDAILQASEQLLPSGGKSDPLLSQDIATAQQKLFPAGRAGASTSAGAAGLMGGGHPGAEAAEHQPCGSQLDAWGLWEPRLTLAGADSPHSRSGNSLGELSLCDEGQGQPSQPGSGTSSPRNSLSLRQDEFKYSLWLSDGNDELTASRIPSLSDGAMPSVSGTKQQFGLADVVDVVGARPEPETDSSSESEADAAEADTHDEDDDEAGSGTIGSHVLVMGSNLSATEIGSVCDSTEAVVDDDETLSRLWTILLPNHGGWLDAQEPDRSALLLRALIVHLQHPSPSTSLRWPVRMRPASSAPAPLRSFNQNRLRLRSFASNHSSRAHPSLEFGGVHHELRELSITDGVPSLSQISSTTSHHSNETMSPRAIPTPSPPTDILTFAEPVLNPLSHPSSFVPQGPTSQPTSLIRTRSEDVCAPASPTSSPPQPHSSNFASHSMHATQKNKVAAMPNPSAVSAPLIHAVLQQLSEDVDTLLQRQEGSHGEALRQLQSISSHLSLRMSRADIMHGGHHTRTRASLALMHLAAVAEDVSPEDRAIVDGEAANGEERSAVRGGVSADAAAAILAGSAVTQSGMHTTPTGGNAGMYPANGRERQLSLSRARRKAAGLSLSRRSHDRFALQRSDSFAGVQQGLADSKRHSGSLPSSPPCNGSVLLNSQCSTLSIALSEGQHHHRTQLFDGPISAGELQLPGSSSLPTSVNGEAPAADPSPLVSAHTSRGQASVELAANCSAEDASSEQMRQSALWGERMLYQASGPAAVTAVHGKGPHRSPRPHSGSVGEKMLQQAITVGDRAVAGSLFGVHTRAELSTIFDTLNVLQDCEAEPLYSTVEDSRGGASRDTDFIDPGADTWHQGELVERGGIQDGELTDVGGFGEAGADIGEDSVPLVHALVVRVLHQFAITKAQH